MNIYGKIQHQHLILAKDFLVGQSVNYLTGKFQFSNDWDELTRICAHFKNGEQFYQIQLVNGWILQSSHCNLTKGKWQLSLHGDLINNGQSTKRITTNIVELFVRDSGGIGGDPWGPYPQNKIEQLQQQIGTKQGTIEDLDEIRAGAAAAAGAYHKPQTGIPAEDIEQGVIPPLVNQQTVANWGFTKNQGTYIKPETGIPASDIEEGVIPPTITEQTVENWGFTKNQGTYIKPEAGIPATDMEQIVQQALELAITALQQVPSEYVTYAELTQYHDPSKQDLYPINLTNSQIIQSNPYIFQLTQAQANIFYNSTIPFINLNVLDNSKYMISRNRSSATSNRIYFYNLSVEQTKTTILLMYFNVENNRLYFINEAINEYVSPSDRSNWNNKQPKTINDIGGYYTTDTVEAALQEIGAELSGINMLLGSGVVV